MESFTIAVPSEVLDDLRSRLARTRYTTPSAPGWAAGADPAYLRSLVEYWATDFDWRAAEARLNAYPQFLDRGQHFVHLRRDASRPPVLLAHGWPSSFVEMLPLADLLDVDVVIPSLPGFLYSKLVDGPITRAAIAEAFHTLMTETLGYERYFAFGGDIGGAASAWLATMYPQEVAGLHVIHGPFPADFDASPITAEEQAFLDGPVEESCRMCNDWEVTHERADLPPELWEYLKKHRFFGMIVPKSRTKSKPSPPTSGSSTLAQYSRIWGSRAFIFFGVNTRDSSPRCAVWSGGSSKMNTPDGISMSALMISRIPPFAELKVTLSMRPLSTSSNRLSA